MVSPIVAPYNPPGNVNRRFSGPVVLEKIFSNDPSLFLQPFIWTNLEFPLCKDDMFQVWLKLEGWNRRSLCFPKNFKGAYHRRCVRLSELISPKPLIRIDVNDNKCFSRQGLVDQGLWRSFWKVQGHSEHIKESNFNISSYLKTIFYQKFTIIEYTHYLGQRSLKVIF
jgi:hypothetical protein